MIKPENFITIQGWMRTELNLKGNDLMVFAIIYGFSQTDNQMFTGSLQYLADWCGATKQGILKNLKNLTDKGYIIKHEAQKDGKNNYVTYLTMFNNPIKHSLTPIKHSLTNNIVNNIENKDINTNTKVLVENNQFDFGMKDKKPKQSLYSKCMAMIHDYTDDLELEELLTTYLRMRLEIKDKPIYANQWKGLLNKLSKLADNLYDKCKIVQQSIDRGYLSFFEVSKRGKEKNNEKVELNKDRYTEEEKQAIRKVGKNETYERI